MPVGESDEGWKVRLRKLGLARKRSIRGPASPKKESSRSTRSSGLAGEEMAVRLLERNGVKIVARNVVVERGEIDVIGQRGKMILFIEVKWRRSAARGNAAVAVTSLKRRRLLHAARVWLSANPGHADRLVRFDVVAIEEEPFQIEWIEGAFDASR